MQTRIKKVPAGWRVHTTHHYPNKLAGNELFDAIVVVPPSERGERPGKVLARVQQRTERAVRTAVWERRHQLLAQGMHAPLPRLGRRRQGA